MDLSNQNILIIVVFFSLSFLLMIPFFIWNNLKKNKLNIFIKKNNKLSIIHIYGEKIFINGKKIKEWNHMKGSNLEYVVALNPGEYEIKAKYEASRPGLTKNVTYKTPKSIKSLVNLEASSEYSLSLYFYSPEDRRNYYNGDVGQEISSQVVDILNSGLSPYTEAYIILYLENTI